MTDPTQSLELLKRFEEIKAQLEAIKPLYDEADRIIQQLARKLPVGHEVQGLSGNYFSVKDNFLDKDGSVKNTAFKSLGIKRFDIEIETPVERAERLEKELKKAQKAVKKA